MSFVLLDERSDDKVRLCCTGDAPLGFWYLSLDRERLRRAKCLLSWVLGGLGRLLDPGTYESPKRPARPPTSGKEDE